LESGAKVGEKWGEANEFGENGKAKHK